MPEGPAVAPRIKVRIEGLSDIVFGLALSIGSLVLIGNLPQTPADLGSDILLFIFSFVLVVISWLLYTRIMSVLPVEVGAALILNIVLLMCVALEPYTLYVLDTTQTIPLLTWSSFAYAVDVGMIYLVLAGLARIFLSEAKRPGTELRVHPAIIEGIRRTMRAELFLGGVFIISALPFFWVLTPIGYLRFDVWYLSFGAGFLWYGRRKRDAKSQ
ncbi:MAG: TMEM175 family protein [Thaumarchaeota archaeon]|nr:TMEM175 family protein [Nitrososphaerota archaeon]